MDPLAAALAPHVEHDPTDSADSWVPGLVYAVEDGPEGHSDLRVGVLGVTEPGGPAIRRDTIFRIASTSKVVTAVAAMMLVEQGVLGLDEPVDRLLPELADRRVLRNEAAELDDTEPAGRPITVEDLLSFRAGFGAPPLAPGTLPWQRAYAAARLGGDGPPGSYPVPPPDEYLSRLGALPLLAQPGERWLYHTGADVLGILVARAAGTTLGEALAERVLAPLGMRDTAFHVPPEKLDRFLPQFHGSRIVDPVDGAWSRPPAFESGGGGLVSTVDDLLALARALRRGGAPRSKAPLLSAETVDAMTTDRLTAAQREASALFLHGGGWGLGMGVDMAPPAPRVPGGGAYGWDGGLGTSWRILPARERIAILLTQSMWSDPGGSAVTRTFWEATGGE